MKRLVLLAWLLCGCVNTQHGGLGVSTSGLQDAVESATGSTRKAMERTACAQSSLGVAAAKSQELLTVASATERPLVVQLETALEETKTEVNAAQEQMRATGVALDESSSQLETVKKEMNAMSAELGQAQEEANRMKASRDFWRACVWKLGLLALALGVWTFRRPLLALCEGGLVL